MPGGGCNYSQVNSGVPEVLPLGWPPPPVWGHGTRASAGWVGVCAPLSGLALGTFPRRFWESS